MFVGQRIVRNRKKKQWLVGSTVSKLCLAKVNRRKKEYKKSSYRRKAIGLSKLEVQIIGKAESDDKKNFRKVVRYVKKDLTRMLNDTAKNLRVFVSLIHLGQRYHFVHFQGFFQGQLALLFWIQHSILSLRFMRQKSTKVVLGLSNTLLLWLSDLLGF